MNYLRSEFVFSTSSYKDRFIISRRTFSTRLIFVYVRQILPVGWIQSNQTNHRSKKGKRSIRPFLIKRIIRVTINQKMEVGKLVQWQNARTADIRILQQGQGREKSNMVSRISYTEGPPCSQISRNVLHLIRQQCVVARVNYIGHETPVKTNGSNRR